MRRTVLALLIVLAAAGCGGDSPMRGNVVGPSFAGAGGPGAVAGMGNAAGGMGMMVTSEFDYLAQMIPHHEEAIATARILQRATERAEMRTFAATIIETQSAEVAQMQAWLAAWYPGRDTTVRYVPMMRELSGLRGSALDRAFLEDMIPHHMMAVMMSQRLAIAGLATHAEVVPFASHIRDVQYAEIQMMTAWLRQWFSVA